MAPAGSRVWERLGLGTVRGCLQVGQRVERPANSSLTLNFIPQPAQEKAIMNSSGRLGQDLPDYATATGQIQAPPPLALSTAAGTDHDTLDHLLIQRQP